MSTFDKVKDIITDKLGVEEEKISAEASFVDDLVADSLDTVELIMQLEEEFGNRSIDLNALFSDVDFDTLHYEILGDSLDFDANIEESMFNISSENYSDSHGLFEYSINIMDADTIPTEWTLF